MLFILCYKNLSLLRFLHFDHDFFGYVEKWLDKNAMVSFKLYGVTDWTANNCNAHITRYLKK